MRCKRCWKVNPSKIHTCTKWYHWEVWDILEVRKRDCTYWHEAEITKAEWTEWNKYFELLLDNWDISHIYMSELYDYINLK